MGDAKGPGLLGHESPVQSSDERPISSSSSGACSNIYRPGAFARLRRDGQLSARSSTDDRVDKKANTPRVEVEAPSCTRSTGAEDKRPDLCRARNGPMSSPQKILVSPESLLSKAQTNITDGRKSNLWKV